MADEPVDQWLKPYERSGDTKAAMKEYLDWEVDLLPRIARDGTLQFERFSGRGFQQQFAKALGSIHHHVVAAGDFVGAPRRIGLHGASALSKPGLA